MSSKIIAHVTLTPIGTQTTSMAEYIAAAVQVLDNYPQIIREPNAMGTILHGEKEEVMEAIDEMREAIFAKGAERVFTQITLDERRDREITPEGKMSSLRYQMGGI